MPNTSPMAQVLVIDDDPRVLAVRDLAPAVEGHRVRTESTYAERPGRDRRGERRRRCWWTCGSGDLERSRVAGTARARTGCCTTCGSSCTRRTVGRDLLRRCRWPRVWRQFVAKPAEPRSLLRAVTLRRTARRLKLRSVGRTAPRRGFGTRGLRLLTEGAWISSRYRRVLIARIGVAGWVGGPAARMVTNGG